MQLNFYLQNFRCFASTGSVRVAPITLLVGENSTGKTSFLAALRQTVEAFSRSTANGFNREPYYLGSFEQIAHYRGGRSGRAREFCLGVELVSEADQADLFSGPRRMGRGIRHTFVYTKGSGQPELSSYVMNSRDVTANFDLTGARPRLGIQQVGRTPIQMNLERGPPSALMRREVSFLGYYLQDLVMRSARDSTSEMEDLSGTDLIRFVSSTLRNTSRTIARNVFASAPVRIQPRRVYIPSELTSSNAGEQVPLDIANLKLSAPERWQQIKLKLNDFGRKSGLFEDIEVKRLGKTDSDPFQIQVKNQGPAANIVDVGYGVSQALPLLYPLQGENDYNFFLLQQPEVHLHPRAQAEFGSLLTSLSQHNPGNTYVVETHSDFIVDRVRSDVRDGVISPSSVSIILFRRNGLDVMTQNLGVDANGDVTGYPEDYREFFLREQARVLGV